VRKSKKIERLERKLRKLRREVKVLKKENDRLHRIIIVKGSSKVLDPSEWPIKLLCERG
jgi:hypothetical protein